MAEAPPELPSPIRRILDDAEASAREARALRSSVRSKLDGAKRRDSESSAGALRSSTATLATLRADTDDMNRRSVERRAATSATAELEARWREFQDRFQKVLDRLADNVGDSLRKEGGADLLAEPGGGAERWDADDDVVRKTRDLAALIRNAEGRVIVFTGAGLSTAAGIPDYRSPLATKLETGPGVWARRGRETTAALAASAEEAERGAAPRAPAEARDLATASPTAAHAALEKLWRSKFVDRVVSQNVDGLHHRSGLTLPDALIELHGNVWVDRCTRCAAERVRDDLVQHRKLEDVSVFNKGAAARCPHCETPDFCHCTARLCETCKGAAPPLKDTIVNFGEALDGPTLTRAIDAAEAADLCIVFGSSCRVAPAGDLPRSAKAHAVVNLQATPLDSTATVRIGARCDDVLVRLCALLGVA